MSETVTRELNTAMTSARRTASQSVGLLKAAAGFGKTKPESEPLEPANESMPEPERPDPSMLSGGAEMTGSIVTPDDLHLHGKLKGDARATKIVVCAGGAVKGDLTADTIIVHGVVEGRIHGKNVMLCAGATMKGEITHSTLGVDTAAVFEGTVTRIVEAAE